MTRIIKTTFIVAALMTFAVASAEARPHGKKGNRKGQKGDRIERIVKKLDLNQEQVAAIKKLRTETKEDMKPLRVKAQELKKKIRAEWKSEKPSEAKIKSLQKKMSRVKNEMGELRIEQRFDMFEVLNSEQRIQLKEMKQKRGKKFDGKRGKRMDGKRDMKADGKRERGDKANRRGNRRGAKRDVNF